MASLLSSWASTLQSLPESYVLPEDKRPGKPVPISKDIPVIDLGDANRAAVVQKIIEAGQEFGVFQVINHGVPENSMIDAKNVGKEFFSIAAEEKVKLNADNAQNGCKLYTSCGRYSNQDFAFWKDTLEHQCHPLESHIKSWPDKPAKYREIVGPYTVEVRQLSNRILDMIYEGLGFTEESFENYALALMIHNYPKCPDPSSALGVGGHYDGVLLTLLQQDAYGLQLFKDGQWIGVEPIPNAFVVNVGFSLEVISNGKLRCALHRAITNSEFSRTSLVNFVNFPYDRIIEPAKSVINPSNLPVFRGFPYKEYLEVLLSKKSDMEATFEHFKIKSQATK